MGEQLRKTWDKTAIPLYLAVAVVLSMGCGYSISAAQNRQAQVETAEVFSKQLSSIRREQKARTKFRDDRIIFLTNQIAELASKSGDTAKAAIDKVEK